MENKVAIIGISFDLPGISNWCDLISTINQSKCHIGDLSEVRKNDVFNRFGNIEVTPGGYLDRIDLFDKEYFNLTEIESIKMSPEQRLMLMHSYRAFYNAGYTERHIQGSKTGIFYVTNKSMYEYFSDEKNMNFDQSQGMECTRIAFFLNIQGPVVCFNTTCSSSLVAMHYACLSLNNKECDIVLTGGVNLGITMKGTSQNSPIISKKGVCKPFDEDADGTLGGEGVICMVLKRYEDALKDNDPIYGVIEGCALNHGGNRISSLTAPSSEAQKEVIKKAWTNSGIKPEDIKYIEAHGTGTFLGDPIEFKGLSDAFIDYGIENNSCSISSFKAQVGHLGILAGSAGVLRLIAALNNKIIPSQVGFNSLNKHINENNSPIHVSRNCETWKETNGKRIGGVSSFGLSGTNAHLVISSEVNRELFVENEDFFYLQISERTQQRLESLKVYLADCLNKVNEINLKTFVHKINRSYLGKDVKEGIIFSSKNELFDKLNKKYILKEKQTKYFLLILSHIQYDNKQIKQIINENELIRKQWDLTSKGSIDLDNITSSKLISILFQYTLCRFLLSVFGKDVTIIYQKEISTIQRLLSGELTVEKVLKNPDIIDRNNDTFNTESFGAYLDQFTKKGYDISIVAFCIKENIKTTLASKVETRWIDGQFQLKDRCMFYSELLSNGKDSLEVNNSKTLINDIELPFFELKRFWPENIKPFKKERNQNENVPNKLNSNNILSIKEIESKLKIFWKEFLEIRENINNTDDFFELGGTSLIGLDILNKIEQEFGIILQYQDIFKYSKLEEMVTLINSKQDNCKSIKCIENIEGFEFLNAEDRNKEYLNLMDTINNMKAPSLISPNKILVTGATGFFGAFLVKKLLDEADNQIVCLIRGENKQDATNRFWNRFSTYFNIYNDSRIQVLVSDITQKDLGLESEALDVLEGIDTVYHSAGIVSHFGKYETSYKVNTEGTINIFNWAIRNNVKWFNHISSRAVVGICIPSSRNDNFYETDINIGQDFINHIYGKTKLKAEEYLHNLDSKMSVNIYRLGNIGGRFSDGLFQYNINQHNFYLQLATLAKINCYSDFINNIRLEITPIDILINTIYKLSRTKNEVLSTFHLSDNQMYSINDIVESFRNNGKNLVKVNSDDFVKKIEDIQSKNNYSKDYVSLGVLKYSNLGDSVQGKGVLEIKNQCTKAYLNKLEVNMDYDRKKYLDTIIKYGKEMRFFDFT